MFRRAITRQPGPDFPRGLSTAGLGPADYATAHVQHRRYVDALQTLGLQVTELVAERDFPDACFVEDVAVMVGDAAVLTRPGAASRRGETHNMLPVLQTHVQEVMIIDPPGFLDGGDVLQVGRRFYVGLSARTNRHGADQFAAITAQHGFETVTIAVGKGLHFKSSVNQVADNLLLVTEDFADHPQLRDHERLVVPSTESYAANSLLINGTVMMPAGFAETRARLAATGLELLELDMSEFQKQDGGLTCLSLRF